ncbi:hypothetical protein ETAA8_08760 [Anatilimnocola aggregata]|uniref:Uncharacterized protein n=1 Tax=Anatilimnocola aggregata TaxID=2528021 RepID=A0A517Y6D6_9BACT|nr:hypothetical protein [Anatilimnocola aggregata]QDU25804.1 hypothetical protein ETAA8_08760 [Anatilimnocola aggregata]
MESESSPKLDALFAKYNVKFRDRDTEVRGLTLRPIHFALAEVYIKAHYRFCAVLLQEAGERDAQERQDHERHLRDAEKQAAENQIELEFLKIPKFEAINDAQFAAKLLDADELTNAILP